jgi:hypothetical protein
MARTAGIAGTATAVSRGVSSAVEGDKRRPQQVAEHAGVEARSELEQMNSRIEAMQAQQAQTSIDAAAFRSAASGSADLVAQLHPLAQLKESGALTDQERMAAKARLLAS